MLELARAINQPFSLNTHCTTQLVTSIADEDAAQAAGDGKSIMKKGLLLAASGTSLAGGLLCRPFWKDYDCCKGLEAY
jgi:hypothetical protein